MANDRKLQTIESLSVDTNKAAIPLDELPRGFNHVFYQFSGHSQDLRLMTKNSDKGGLRVQADQLWKTGPVRVKASGDEYTQLRTASGSTTVDIEVFLANGNEAFVHGPAGGGRVVTNTVATEEQKVNEVMPAALLASGLGPEKYAPTSLDAEHLVESNAARLIKVNGFVPGGNGNGSEVYAQLWDGDPTGTGQLVDQEPFIAESSDIDNFKFDETVYGIPFPDGIYFVLSTDYTTNTPAGFGAIVNVRYVV